ncbi:MAG: methionyl-tRNA formyltransferase [Campylobacter sp.]|nr:methionyl-tRNA formyltransferase [Campylobacter sp.]
MKQKIIIATLKSWNIKNYKKLGELYPEFSFFLVQKEQDLSLEFVKKIEPKYIFFPHWSFYIPKELYENYECIVFHMSDLPFGRGGSPLQNLILRNIKKTKISALRVCEELDAGDIYLKKSLDISKGSAEQIYKKASKLIFFKMIPRFFKTSIKAKPQKGEVIIFKRRKAEQSCLNTLQNPNLNELYNFIRMLDAPTYPKAFLEFGNFKLDLSKVQCKNQKLIGRFEIYEK